MQKMCKGGLRMFCPPWIQQNPPSSVHQCHWVTYELFSVHDPPWTQIHSILLLSSPCVVGVCLKLCSIKTKSLARCLIVFGGWGCCSLQKMCPHWSPDWLRVCSKASPRGDQAEQGELCSAEEITLAGTRAAKGFLRSTCVWQTHETGKERRGTS